MVQLGKEKILGGVKVNLRVHSEGLVEVELQSKRRKSPQRNGLYRKRSAG